MKLRTTMENMVMCHPRRDFARDDWLSLNGVWEFAIDECDVGERDEWFLNVKRFDRKIIVPFPIQSKMAWGEKGGNKPIEYASELKDYYGVVWYKRKISVPKAWKGKRVILKFGAVDWYTRVWVNEKFVGEHYGGYLPFEFDITDYISYEKENFIVVRVFDPQDTSGIPVGKQQNWYTRTTGIWQTVYLEAREEFFIKNIKITPDVDAGKVKFTVHTGGNNHSCKKYQLVIEIPAADVIEVIESSGEEIIKEIVIKKPRLWSPERPYLYDTTVRLKFGIDREDVVKTYFGMRKVSTCFLPGKDYKYIYLNNKPIYIRGVLDQGFNPDGVYTYPICGAGG
jgi:beta-galactosidase/beta-glucuronidase